MLIWRYRSRKGGDEKNGILSFHFLFPLCSYDSEGSSGGGREGREDETETKERVEVKKIENFYEAMKKRDENKEARKEWVPKSCLRAEYS